MTGYSLASAQQPIQDGTGRNFTMVTNRDAEYPGGNVAMAKYFYKYMMYPEAAKANKVQGDIMVVFMVGPDSLASDVRAMKDLGYGTKEEAERLIKAAKFIPALQNGQPIRQQMMVSVPFRIYD
jgi:protein TonB